MVGGAAVAIRALMGVDTVTAMARTVISVADLLADSVVGGIAPMRAIVARMAGWDRSWIGSRVGGWMCSRIGGWV